MELNNKGNFVSHNFENFKVIFFRDKHWLFDTI